jgi:hypothetical protein
MWRVSGLILLGLLLFPHGFAQTTGIELKNPNQKKKEVEAGSSINTMLMFANTSEEPKRFAIRLINDDPGIKLISDYSSILINKQSTTNKIVGIVIPTNLRSGDFELQLELIEEGQTTPFARVTVPLDVKPKIDFVVDKISSESYVFAGDTMRVGFIIHNKSNQAIDFSSKRVYQQTITEKTHHLPKDSSLLVTMVVKTSKEITTYTKQSLYMTVSVPEKPELEKTIYHSFDVFPSNQKKFDRFNRFPLTISGMGISSNRSGPRMYASMFEVTGNGYLDQDKKNLLEVHLRGPNRAGNPLFGQNDLYYLGYKSKHVEVSLGDVNYSLSELTESARNGRGAMGKLIINKWSLGGFYNQPRYYPAIRQVFAASSDLKFNDENQLSVGVMGKTDTLNHSVFLASVYGNNKPFKWLSTRYEISAGQVERGFSTAYKGFVLLRFGRLTANTSYMHADYDFPGFVTNSTRISAGLNGSFKIIGLSLSYDYNDTNKALDTIFANDPFSENLSLSTNVRLGKNASVSFGLLRNNAEDKSPTPQFKYLRESVRLTLNTTLGRLTSNFGGDVGQMNNFLLNVEQKSSYINGSGYLSYRFSDAVSSSLFCTYQGGQQQNVTGYDRFYYGGMVSVVPRDRYSFILTYNSNYEFQDYTSDRSLLSLQSGVKINDKNHVRLGVNYNLMKNTLDTKELNIQLNYTHILGVPVNIKKDVGSLTGKLVNKGVGSVENIRLSLDGMIAITDKNGNFRFPSVKVGKYMLGTLESSFGINSITELPGPFWVEIVPAKTTYFEIALTKSARVSGTLNVQEDERAGQKGFIPIKENIDKVVVEATNGTDVYRIFTNSDGSFVFGDLRPGDWKIKVYPNGLPQGYQLIKGDFNVTLAPGQHEALEVVVQKKARQIRFQNSF